MKKKENLCSCFISYCMRECDLLLLLKAPFAGTAQYEFNLEYCCRIHTDSLRAIFSHAFGDRQSNAETMTKLITIGNILA